MKSRMATNDENRSRHSVQLFSAPSPINARRDAAKSPIDQAAAAISGPNCCHGLRDAASRLCSTWGGSQVEHKRLAASRRPWQQFGPLMAAAAWSMGLFAASRRAFIGDGAENNWTLWRERFSSFVAILDFIHALSYV